MPKTASKTPNEAGKGGKNAFLKTDAGACGPGPRFHLPFPSSFSSSPFSFFFFPLPLQFLFPPAFANTIPPPPDRNKLEKTVRTKFKHETLRGRPGAKSPGARIVTRQFRAQGVFTFVTPWAPLETVNLTGPTELSPRIPRLALFQKLSRHTAEQGRRAPHLPWPARFRA